MTRSGERLLGFLQMFSGDEHPIRVERGDGENGDPGRRKRVENTGQDACEGEIEGTGNFDLAPTALPLDAGRDCGLLADDGEFGWGAGDRRPGALRQPGGEGSGVIEAANGEMAGMDTVLKPVSHSDLETFESP